MRIKSTKHAVYDLKYHVVWIPKYRKQILSGEVSGYLEEVFQHTSEDYEFSIDTMEVVVDHVHIFIEVPTRYSPAQVVEILKGMSARKVFKKFPKLRKELWAGESWNHGYLVRSVGDEVTAEIIRKYIEYQIHKENSSQLRMFETP